MRAKQADLDLIQRTSDRLYGANFFGRSYLADYVAEVQTLCTEVERLRAALQRIKDQCGRVCDEFELCRHRACQSSYEAWSIADAALQGETPESANVKALASHKE